MAFYKDRYDAIVIGGALAGMSCALSLAKAGKSVLILERHNLPGGIATSFVRSGKEMEATLHEMMSLGPKDDPLYIRDYLEKMNVAIDWLRVPEAYELTSPKDGIDIVLHAGYKDQGKLHYDDKQDLEFIAANEIEKAYPGNRDEVNHLLNLCRKVYLSTLYLNDHTLSKLQMLKDHEELVKTAGYSTKEVMDTFALKKEVKDILSAYWVYVGQPISSLPFTIYSFLMADYFLGGSYVARGFSHGMSVAMAKACEKAGVQFEYCQEVEKILVEKGHVKGVRTKRGDTIYSDYVASAPYPNKVFSTMIEPKSEVPERAYQSLNARKMSVTCFSVVMLLDQKPEDLNIHSYSVFSSEIPFDTDKFWEEGKHLGGWSYLSTICLNLANPQCTPEGMTSLSITVLPLPEAFFSVKADDYYSMKRRLAKEMIDKVSARLGINLLDHIVEIEMESPMTMSRYTGDYNGGAYGYQHSMDDSVVARLAQIKDDIYIQGLAWCASHALTGNGMACNINNGRIAARTLLTMMEEDEKKGERR
ncbi:MAG: NAD(P)/FAD-dependent oxidoreductase [Eubacteriales bacterium]|nr:NAD(P)/FAD-dependent oxidoreductase [Eubacteriales bacterium]